MKYKVSIIVPCYQVEQFIYESVLSMAKQDFDSYEIILVDDGTKDRSIEVAKKALLGFSNYKVVNKVNGGLPSARNAGIEVAEGEYVCFLDSDDIVAPSHLKDLYDLCVTEKLNASFALFEQTNETNRYGTVVNESTPTVIEREQFLSACMDRSIKVHCCALMINKDYLVSNNLYFDERLKYAEDTEYRWRLFPKLERIGCTNKHTYKYLTRSNSLMRSQSIERVQIAMNIICSTIQQDAKEFPEYYDIWSMLPQRVNLSFCKSFAKSSAYHDFKQLITTLDHKPNIEFIIKYKNIKVKMLSLAFITSKRFFYYVSQL